MKNLVFVLVLLICSTAYAGKPSLVPPGTTRSTPNIFGGQNYYGRNGFQGRSMRNNMGDYNYYGPQGRINARGYKGLKGSTRYQFYR